MNEILPMTVPACTCCAEPTALLPRPELPGGLAVCATTGQPYRLEEGHYVPTTLPDMAPRAGSVAAVRIDLSRSGYA